MKKNQSKRVFKNTKEITTSDMRYNDVKSPEYNDNKLSGIAKLKIPYDWTHEAFDKSGNMMSSAFVSFSNDFIY